MATIAEAFSLAVSCAQVGQSSQAEQICRRILAVDPLCGDAWHLLGVIALQGGNLESAADSLVHAVAANPADSEALSNLGIALHSLGKRAEAIERFREAVRIRPDFAEAQYNLANALHETGRIDEAIDAYCQSLKFRPTDAVIHNNLANALRENGQEAEAIAAFARAIDVRPDYAEAHYNLGSIYKKAGRNAEAIASYRRVIELNPQSAEAYSNLAAILKDDDRLDEAAACYRRAIELKPDLADTYYNLGIALGEQARFEEALTCYERAIAIEPNYVDAHFNRSQLLLGMGDFKRGWEEYEWRWRRPNSTLMKFPQPLWDGCELHGKTIFVYEEQGSGDTIQFVRFASALKAMGATVIFGSRKPMLKLLASFQDIDHLVGEEDPIPRFDFHAPLLSLPRLLATSLETIPARIPYLFADSSLVEYWRGRLAGVRGFRVGINWQGRVGPRESHRRDIPLDCLAALAQIPSVQLICLQKGPGREQLVRSGAPLPILDPGDDIDEGHGPFMDSAAIMNNVHLVISSDTSVAHLAGALGVPVFVPLPWLPDWRWLLDRTDSPWYPTMRLFRQKTPGDWTNVFAEIQAALRQLVSEIRCQ